ncbi:acetyltransferase [Rhizorhabdus histidinilytica]|uniref:acetyltransferase n=1 Tax=Rhizorhabdus histidinilytica TaxID=439228 RepID=UPI00321FCFC2
MIRIRPMRPAEGARAVEIWGDAVDATHDFLTPKDRAAIGREVAEFLPGAPLWLAVGEDDHAIGFLLMNDSHMEALFVDPRHRGAGVGRALVDHAAALHGAVTTDVNEQNGQAVGFYRRLGFVPTGRSDRDGQGRPYPLVHLLLDRPLSQA